MRRASVVPFALALVAAFLPLGPASAITPAGFDCGADDGREQVTADGLRYAFTAPDVRAVGHDIAGIANVPWPRPVMEAASAHFLLRANLAPYVSGDIRVALAWAAQGDFDLYAFDDDGAQIASSTNFNPLDGNGEAFTLENVGHCADLEIVVMNYAGQDDEPLTLDVTLTNPGPTFACEEEDPHLACEGKAEGEAPDRIDDARTRLWFGGSRPGQLAMPANYVNKVAGSTVVEGQGLLVKDRPSAGRTNTFTHTGQGFSDQGQNPFMANYTIPVSATTNITGDLHVRVWVSSETMQGVGDEPPGTLYVDLFADSLGAALAGTALGRIEVPGTEIGTAPTPITVTFEDLDVTIEEELTVQIAAEPVATSEGATGSPSDAHFTVYYDSVQFPSGITLDTPANAFAG